MYLKKFLKFIFNRAKSLHLKKLFFSHKAREQKGGEREMAKKSMTPSERREAILKVLCQRRQDKIDNLAFEFGVSVRTIKTISKSCLLLTRLKQFVADTVEV